MSAIGSSVVNKSGKKVAPRAPARRRPGAAAATASSLSARSSVEPTRQPEADAITGEVSDDAILNSQGAAGVELDTDGCAADAIER